MKCLKQMDCGKPCLKQLGHACRHSSIEPSDIMQNAPKYLQSVSSRINFLMRQVAVLREKIDYLEARVGKESGDVWKAIQKLEGKNDKV